MNIFCELAFTARGWVVCFNFPKYFRNIFLDKVESIDFSKNGFWVKKKWFTKLVKSGWFSRALNLSYSIRIKIQQEWTYPKKYWLISCILVFCCRVCMTYGHELVQFLMNICRFPNLSKITRSHCDEKMIQLVNPPP